MFSLLYASSFIFNLDIDSAAQHSGSGSVTSLREYDALNISLNLY